VSERLAAIGPGYRDYAADIAALIFESGEPKARRKD
jgi:hypothetical protein